MSWFGEPKDLIAIVIATLAVILSLVTVLIQKQQQQRDAYRQIYDVLMSPELHRGRWMIVDMNAFRYALATRGVDHCLQAGAIKRKSNGDGTHFWANGTLELLCDSRLKDKEPWTLWLTYGGEPGDGKLDLPERLAKFFAARKEAKQTLDVKIAKPGERHTITLT